MVLSATEELPEEKTHKLLAGQAARLRMKTQGKI